MKRLAKALMLTLAGFIVLTVGISIVLRIKYPPEKLKAMVLAEIGSKLHREAGLESVSLSLWEGIRLNGFRLSNRPSFAAGTFIECETFSLKPSYLRLLKGHLAISRLVLESPAIQIVRNSDKTFNFSDLSENEPAAPAGDAASARTAAPLVLAVDRIAIRNGKAVFLDRSDGSETSLENIDLSVRDFSTVRPFPLELSFSIRRKAGGTTLRAPMTLQGMVSLPFGIEGTLSSPQITHDMYQGKDLKVVCDLHGKSPDLAAIEGSVDLSMGSGEIHPSPLIKTIAAVIDPSLSKLTYDSLKARALFEKGTIRVENGELHGGLDLLVHGTYTAATGALNFLAQAKGKRYSLPVDFAIGGTIDHPTCRLKTSQVIRGAVQKMGGSVTDMLKKSIGGIFNPQ